MTPLKPMTLLKPLIENRADPHIHRHGDGYYYFTASVPAFDHIELRRAATIGGLATATPVAVWRKPDGGPCSELIWAPELHFSHGVWQIYFAAAPSRAIRDNLFQHRIHVISCASKNPMDGIWTEPVKIDTGLDTFSLDATGFAHKGVRYLVWAQKEPGVPGNSNLYIAPLETPVKLAGAPVRLSRPEFDWETRGFSVNEGPAVLIRYGRVFLTYSASATDENYCLGMLHADAGADLLNPASWRKSPKPVFQTCHEHNVFGPGHNSFTVSENGKHDLIVFHARTYTEIVGDPLWNPDRHTYVKVVKWDSQGMPDFGKPSLP